ncbi:glycoside hydrolase family 2 TIM barrel-domain containing protein [Zobellia galactanivorans]|uniref:Beta-galactosidase, family GH2 n=1 Tax=Zobellia galactanivorans (strain DSM 12802 / CCUG 47099 / CIP 106680 / NCIMB 13871 / Dsij) TaxID=63186 RepID=G0LBU6_ZOBGA|nr:glycoside hydrolase family 2 TIM barrel-domain containing protein [Zobellia galactanivorans]CAZ96465.1 Beta-galactosidase, family GH2 [Zobellia galactanivorans]
MYKKHLQKQCIPTLMLLFLFCLISSGFASPPKSDKPIGERISFDANWKFIQQDIPGAEQVEFNDNSWRILDLPHDWSIEGEYDKNNPMGDQCGYLPAGFGWYRKTITVPREWKGKHIEIAFDGAFMNSTVWANGQELGTRPYGWISFAYDISEMAQTSDQITFAVRIDNDLQPSARWYTGSGIYAHTWIDIKNNTHIPRNGIFIRTEGDKVFIDTEVFHKNKSAKNVRLITTVLNKDGEVIASSKDRFEKELRVKTVLNIKNAIRWSPENPYLYTLKTELLLGKKVVDLVQNRFGIRDIEWKAETGMWMNGKNIKLRGVCNHQDAGALGAAVPYKILLFRIQQLKNMGVNAIRTAHNPQTPEFYDICDEIGIMVMDEIFDGWKKKAKNDYGAHHFEKWWKQDITDWIKRDRNHPSIVIYSVGNETRGEVGKDLVETCNLLDPTRPVTSGHSGSKYMNVLGVNGGSEKKGFLENLKENQSGKVFIGTENTHTWQVRGYYRTKTWFRDGFPNPKQRPYDLPDLTEKEVFTHDWIDGSERKNRKQIFNSSYDNATVRVSSRLNIAQLRDIPAYAGSFRWTGHDYIGEAGYVHGGWPFKAFMGGAIDIANFEKDLYYLYQSQWTTEPMVHILPHWTHPKVKLNTKIPVWVYSNCDEVELFFNGLSLGKQKPGKAWDKMQCQWLVKWQPGTLKAIGYKDGKAISEEMVSTANEPAKIQLSIDGETLGHKTNDIVQVRVSTTDNKGTFYPYGENRTYFNVFGAGKIKALDNGSPVDTEQHVGPNHRKAFYGLIRAYIESTNPDGDINVLASSILGEKKLITSKSVSIDTEIITLRGSQFNPDIKIFYTTNGDRPTSESTPYNHSFEIGLETTVKALIVVDGEPFQILEETFGKNEGFSWNKTNENSRPIGEQAEDATLSNAEISSKGTNFNGKGYVNMNNTGAIISWYQENDGGAGSGNLFIRYSTKETQGTSIKISINGKTVRPKLQLPHTGNLGNTWKTVNIPIEIDRGANTINLEGLENKSLFIDEISVR